MEQHQRLAILVGGGPAPGINSVIAAATIRAKLENIEVFGIRDGFEWLMQGDSEHVIPLSRRLLPRDRAREPDQRSATPGKHRQRPAAAEGLAAHYDRWRRYGVFRN